jgi:hypothetical protein
MNRDVYELWATSWGEEGLTGSPNRSGTHPDRRTAMFGPGEVMRLGTGRVWNRP